LRAAAAGRAVTLVERDRLGGVCLNVGCIPSKALIHVADTAALPDETGAIGVDLAASVDLDRAQAWIGDVVGRLTGGVEQLLRDAGVTVATGTARFATARRVAVTRGDDAAFFEFTSLVLATGSRPVDLVSLPFDGRTVLDSTAALALRRVPGRITVVGGGYIGVELGGAFAKLGADVTIVEMADHLLPGMPTGLARALERALRARGLMIRLGTKVLGQDGDDLVVEGPAGEARLPIGADGVVFSDPQVATVGLTADQAAEAGVDAATFRFPLSASGRALALARPEGYVEIVAGQGDGTVLGVHMVGAGVAELAAEAALAIEMAATVDDVALTIAPHPTLSEAMAEAAMGAAGRPLHIRRRKHPPPP